MSREGVSSNLHHLPSVHKVQDECKADPWPSPGYHVVVRKSLTDILVCPLCKGPLNIVTFKEDGDEIVEGRFDCAACGVSYPVDDGIPNMLPPDLRD